MARRARGEQVCSWVERKWFAHEATRNSQCRSKQAVQMAGPFGRGFVARAYRVRYHLAIPLSVPLSAAPNGCGYSFVIHRPFLIGLLILD